MAVNNPAVKRIMGELKELTQGARPDDHFVAAPLEDNLFEWHFSIRGPAGTAFDGGVYHGKITLPAEYPFRPPSITLLTPNGRFEVGKKICLSVSAHHPEHWQPAWGIRTIITALIAFMPTKADGALAGLDYTDEERRELAARSHAWQCPSCDAKMNEAMPCQPAPSASATPAPSPAVPAGLRFGDEPAAPAGAPLGGDQASASALATQTAEVAPPEPPEPPAADAGGCGCGRAHAPAEASVEPTSPATLPPPRPPQPHPQRQQQPPRASGIPNLVWALALAILALIVRKLLRSGDAA